MLNQHKHFQDHGLQFRKRIVGAELARRVKKNIPVSISDQPLELLTWRALSGSVCSFRTTGQGGIGATLRLFSKRAMYRIEDSLHRGVTTLPAVPPA